MGTKIHLKHAGTGSAVTLAVVLAWALPAAAQQQPDEIPVKLRFKYDLKEDEESVTGRLNVIRLRPNTEQPIYLFAENYGPDLIRGLNVKLLKIEEDGSEVVLKETTLEALESKKLTPIRFQPAKDKKEPPKDAKKDAPPGVPLAGPPFELQVWFERAKVIRREPLPVRLMEPREYVEIGKKDYLPKTQTLSVEVKTKDAVHGPPIVARLELAPDMVPGLVPVKARGTYKQMLLPLAKESATLRAEEMQFRGLPPEFGRVYVTVDEYERAFLINNSFTRGEPREMDHTAARLRLFAPRYTAPSAKTPLRIEVDNPPVEVPRLDLAKQKDRPKPLLVRVSLDLDGTGARFLPVKELVGHRQQALLLNPDGPGGALLLKNTVRDWLVELDTTDLYGKRQVKAQLLKYDAKTNAYRPVALVKEQESAEEKILLLEEATEPSPYAPLHYLPDDAAAATVTLDGTPPEIDLGFNLEKQETHVRGAPLVVKAKIVDPDPVSPIAEVVFFLGEPTPKGTVPEKAIQVKGKNVPPKSTVWEAEIPVPTAKPAAFEISVLALNQAGLSNVKTIKLILVDPPLNGKGKGAKISGIVTVGGLPQAGVGVSLSDPKGELKGFTRTDAKVPGVFVFEGVPPGTYQISASNPALKLSGQTLVQVPEGAKEIKDVKIEMKR